MLPSASNVLIYILGTNISPPKALLKMVFLFPRWLMFFGDHHTKMHPNQSKMNQNFPCPTLAKEVRQAPLLCENQGEGSDHPEGSNNSATWKQK